MWSANALGPVMLLLIQGERAGLFEEGLSIPSHSLSAGRHPRGRCSTCSQPLCIRRSAPQPPRGGYRVCQGRPPLSESTNFLMSCHSSARRYWWPGKWSGSMAILVPTFSSIAFAGCRARCFLGTDPRGPRLLSFGGHMHTLIGQ